MRERRKSGVALALGLALASACGGRVAKDAETLRADVEYALGGSGGATLDCRMLAGRRDGVCSYRTESFQADAIVSRLQLVEINLRAEVSYGVLDTLARTTECHKTIVPPGGSGVRAYGTYQRPASLKLTKGARFEYLFLFRVEATGETCLQVSYAES